MGHDLLASLIDETNLFVGFLCFVIAITHLLVKKKKPLDVTLIAIYSSYSIIIVSYSLEVSGKMQAYPHLLGLSWPFHLFVAASFYLYVRTLISSSYSLSNRDLLYYLPGLIYFLSLIPFIYLKSGAEKVVILTQYYEFDFISLLNLVYFNGVIAIFSFLCISELRLFFSRERLKNIKPFRIFFFLLIMAIVGIILNCIGLIIESEFILRIDSMVFNFVLLAPFFLSRRYPNFVQELTIEISKEKYKQSQLNGLNIESVLSRLNFLFGIEKIYMDPELNIGKLSKRLLISNHQLSEILNKNLKINYSSFISNHRIEEAKALLISNPDDSILKIAHAVGFNSKSAFNVAFKKSTSLTPSEFRKQNGIRDIL